MVSLEIFILPSDRSFFETPLLNPGNKGAWKSELLGWLCFLMRTLPGTTPRRPRSAPATGRHRR
jgi:hypothetical protein